MSISQTTIHSFINNTTNDNQTLQCAQTRPHSLASAQVNRGDLWLSVHNFTVLVALYLKVRLRPIGCMYVCMYV
jgi:hypothetical protein